MSFTITLTYGTRYTLSGFATEDEAMDFIAKYRGNEDRMRKDFDDLPYAGMSRNLDHDLNEATITEKGK